MAVVRLDQITQRFRHKPDAVTSRIGRSPCRTRSALNESAQVWAPAFAPGIMGGRNTKMPAHSNSLSCCAFPARCTLVSKRPSRRREQLRISCRGLSEHPGAHLVTFKGPVTIERRRLATSEENMDKPPTVSVIIIFFNVRDFLEEAINSVVGQTYSDWELLLVDDGSTDGSAGIALKFARLHRGKVRYLTHRGRKNRGMSASRNLGISNATGDYVTFLDGDDVWFLKTLEQRVCILRNQPGAAMVFGNREYWQSWTGDPGACDTKSQHKIECDRLFRPPTLLDMVYVKCKMPNPGSDIIFKREVAIRLGGYEEQFEGLFEDQVFLVKVFLREWVFVSDACWTRYRQRPNSSVAIATGSNEYARLLVSFLQWRENYLSQNGMRGTQIWKATHDALWYHQHPKLYRLSLIARVRGRWIKRFWVQVAKHKSNRKYDNDC